MATESTTSLRNINMKKIIQSLLLSVLFSTTSLAGDAIVSWSHPTAYEDGSPLPIAEISGTVIYYGNVAGGPYPNTVVVAAPATTTTVTGLSKGNWYFVATSIATNNLESVKSNEVVKAILSTSRPKSPKMQ